MFILAAVAYVNEYAGRAVHVLGIRLYKSRKVCTYLHTYYMICFQHTLADMVLLYRYRLSYLVLFYVTLVVAACWSPLEVDSHLVWRLVTLGS